MKCPKCGYLGFETTDRCRNCGYDFSLAVPPPPVELPLREAAEEDSLADLALHHEPPDEEPAVSLHEREAAGFGRPEPRSATPSPPAPAVSAPPGDSPRGLAAPVPSPPDEESGEDLPLFAPRPAGTPLAVRRQGHEVPKARRTTRPARPDTPVLPLGSETRPTDTERSKPTRARPPDLAGMGGRLGAAAIDLALLVAIDVAVLWLTLRIAGLTTARADLFAIRPVPMVAFLLVLAFLYLTGFTVGGGQTIGKMLTGIRVTGDDGRGVDITGAVVRALGCLAAIATFGLLFAPAFFGTERRAVHDRLAGTRVVNG
jgi:uncharacterized RDD family membrane protein YckC